MKIPAVAHALGYIHEDLIHAVLENQRMKKQIAWKKWAAVAACIVVLLGITSFAFKRDPARMVTENDIYAIMDNDGTYTLRFHEPLPDKDKGNANLSSPGGTYVNFDTVAKMKEAIETGNFSKQQLDTIRNRFARKDGEILSVNTNKLYEAALPEEMEATKVTWNGQTYNFRIESNYDDAVSGTLMFETKDRHNTHKEDMMKFMEINKDVVQYKEDDRDATVYEYTSAFGISMRIIIYTLQTDGKTVMVHETYRMSGTEAKFQGVWLCGEQDGAYFYADIEGDSRPSVEWLLSIGLKPYTETAVQ